MPNATVMADNGVYVLRFVHAIISLRDTVFTTNDLVESCHSALTTTDSFLFNPLDIWRIRSELFVFVQRLTVMFKVDKISEYSPDIITDTQYQSTVKSPQLPLAPIDGSCTDPDTQFTVPRLLDFDFLTGLIEVGDMIEYRPRESLLNVDPENFTLRATVIGIRLEADGMTKSLQLNTGDFIVDPLHLVRRVSMRNMQTNQPMYNPIRAWRELSSIMLHPTEFVPTHAMHSALDGSRPNEANDLGRQSETNCHTIADHVAPEMSHPDNIVVDDCSATKRQSSSERYKNTSNKLDEPRTGDLGSCLNWMTDNHEKYKEVEFLNNTYRKFLAMGDIASFYKLVATVTESEYKTEKKLIKQKLYDRNKARWIKMTILLPLCFFSMFTGIFGSIRHNVVVDDNYDSTQTLREFNRKEGTVKFERTVSLLSIQTCSICRTSQMDVMTKEPAVEDIHICAKCTTHKLKPDYYLQARLQPIWYERIANATSHEDYKLDDNGNKIVRYDIPRQLASLTMSEQLLIRRCAPYIPCVHISGGFMGIKGHCVAFPQNITDMCNVLPQRPESVVTFIRQMGNKDTSAVFLKHMRVSKKKVVNALQWLKLHHEGYHDITIDVTQLDWMKGKDVATVAADSFNVPIDEQSRADNRQFVSQIQCAADLRSQREMEFSTMAMSDIHHVPNFSQSEPIRELVKVTEATNQSEKLLMFPPHGDTPIR